MDSEPKKPLNEVDEFLDLVQNKYAIRIKMEANSVNGPLKLSRGLTYRVKTLGGMLWQAVEYYRTNPVYYNDVRQLIASIKLQGYYEETEGLPKKYSECADKLEEQLKRNRELRTEMENLIENYERLKEENTNLKTEVDTLRRR